MESDDIQAMRKGAQAFKRLADVSRKAGKVARANTLRHKLLYKFKEAEAEIRLLYIHPATIKGQDLLKGRIPVAVLEHALDEGAAVFGTEHPRQHWFVTAGGIDSSVSLSVALKFSTMHVYPLDSVKETDLCQLILT